MILATHAIVGAGIGRLFFQSPITGFILAFISHFVLDAIPHSEYSLKSFVKDPNDPLKNDMIIGKSFIRDIFFIAIDCLGGIILSIYIFQGTDGFYNLSYPLLMGVLGGVLPDALQFTYFKTREEPFRTLQKLHIWVDNNNGSSAHPLVGTLSQFAIIILTIILSRFFIS